MKPGNTMVPGDYVVSAARPYTSLPRIVTGVGAKQFLSVQAYDKCRGEETREINRFYVLEDGE